MVISIIFIVAVVLTHSTTNYFLFDPQGHIHHYNGPDDIMNSFIEYRLPFYQKRRDALLKQLKEKLTILKNKANFLDSVISGKLNLRNRPMKDVEEELKQLGLVELPRSPVDGSPVNFDYLLNIPISGLTSDKFDELHKDIDKVDSELKSVQEKTSKDLWIEDLQQFREEFLKVGAIGHEVKFSNI